MNVYALKYSPEAIAPSFNLGDDIQTIAASRLLLKVDGYVSRDALDSVNEPCIVSMNGFFMGSSNWPPSPLIEPIFFAFHISPKWEHVVCSPAGLKYLKEKEPIGCRDRGTAALLTGHGIDAYYSKCVTLTFDRRDSQPRDGKVFMVAGAGKDLFEVVPKAIRKNAVIVNQAKVQLPGLSHQTRMSLATNLLKVYREQASLIITSKIHCAMPCIAMGIPVVFLYDHSKKDDYRVEIVKDFVPINYVNKSQASRRFLNPRAAKHINWQPEVIDFEQQKAQIRAAYQAAFDRAKARFEARFCQA